MVNSRRYFTTIIHDGSSRYISTILFHDTLSRRCAPRRLVQFFHDTLSRRCAPRRSAHFFTILAHDGVLHDACAIFSRQSPIFFTTLEMSSRYVFTTLCGSRDKLTERREWCRGGVERICVVKKRRESHFGVVIMCRDTQYSVVKKLQAS